MRQSPNRVGKNVPTAAPATGPNDGRGVLLEAILEGQPIRQAVISRRQINRDGEKIPSADCCSGYGRCCGASARTTGSNFQHPRRASGLARAFPRLPDGASRRARRRARRERAPRLRHGVPPLRHRRRAAPHATRPVDTRRPRAARLLRHGTTARADGGLERSTQIITSANAGTQACPTLASALHAQASVGATPARQRVTANPRSAPRLSKPVGHQS